MDRLRHHGAFASGVLAVFAVLSSALPVQGFRIVEPASDTALSSGQTITARVDTTSDVGVVEVRYYWYFELEEVVREGDVAGQAGLGKAPSLVAAADSQPPFGGRLQVPGNAIGAMRLLAVGEITRGRLGTRTVFDEIVVDVKPNAKLTAIDFDTEKPLKFGRAGREAVYAAIDSLGKTYELPVVGLYEDDVIRPIRLANTGTTYESSDEGILKVHPDGLLQLMGNGRATVTARNSGVEGRLQVRIEVPEEFNEPPEADPGSNRTVRSGNRVVLNGLRSFDPEGGGLRYHWAQVRGAKVPLLDLNMPQASFQAPEVSEPKLLRFSLRVTDKKEADSLPAYVDVTVKP